MSIQNSNVFVNKGMAFSRSDPIEEERHLKSSIGARVYPPALSKFLTTYYAEKGIRMLSGAMLTSIRKEGETYYVSIGGQETIWGDAVIAGLGIAPDTESAETAGVAVENGILVDKRLETSAPDVFAAGDVAAFFSPALAKRIRVEHEDNALSMGEFAGPIDPRTLPGRIHD